jgi:uncharacterized protein (TIRG00374 family)
MSRFRLALIALGLALSAAAVYLLVRSINVGEAMQALGRTSPLWFSAAMVVSLLSYYVRTLRWREILAPQARPPLGRLFSATMIGFLAINTLPARLGELVRAYVLARKERLSTATVFGSVAVERIFDLVLLGVFWALSLLFAPFPAWFRWSGFLTIGIGLLAGILLWAFHAAREHHSKWGEVGFMARMPDPVRAGVSRLVPAFGAGVQIFGRPALLVGVTLWSAAAWLVSGAVFLLVGESLGMHLPAWSLFLLSFVVCVGIMVPSSPGFIGVLEGACVVGLSLIGRQGPETLAFGILYHLTQILPLLVLGSYFVVREHLTTDLLRSATAPEGISGRKK